MATTLGLTERAIALILRDLREAGYVRAERDGRRVVYTVVPSKPVRGSLKAPPTVGRFLQLFAEAGGFRSYYFRLRVAEPALAQALAAAMAEHGAVLLEREAEIVALLWPAAESDEPEEWEERTFAEAVSHLRAWSGDDPERELTVLEQRSVDAPEDALRHAS